MIVENKSATMISHTDQQPGPVKNFPVMRIHCLPQVVNSPISSRMTATHKAVTADTQSTHHADAMSSWPQSIDGLNGSDSIG